MTDTYIQALDIVENANEEELAEIVQYLTSVSEKTKTDQQSLQAVPRQADLATQ